MLIEIDDERISDLQRESIKRLLALAHGSHYIDVHVRKDGQNHFPEADWLRHATLGRKPLRFLDRLGWPVERVQGRPVLNFFRLLIHTRKITRNWQPPIFVAYDDAQSYEQSRSETREGGRHE